SAAIEDRVTGAVFSIGSERQRAAWMEEIRASFDVFLSLVHQHLQDSPEAIPAALDVILRRKAIGAEAQAAQRDAALSGKDPLLEPPLRGVTTPVRQIAQATGAGPGPEGLEIHQKRLDEWTARKEQLES